MNQRKFCATLACALFLLAAATAQAQWQLQSSGTKAGLRGIHAVSASVAWASGTNGTILRTVNGGHHWHPCTVPPNAAKLDFRSIWAWDKNHAMVLSSGPGTQSRLYSTQDGCRTWQLTLTNPDADGFWDALQFDGTRFGVILGDPVGDSFVVFATYDGGMHWTRQHDACLRVSNLKQGVFAASNQSLAIVPFDSADSPYNAPPFQGSPGHHIWFGTSGGWLYGFDMVPLELIAGGEQGCTHTRVLSSGDSQSAGIFALAFRDGREAIAVGGDYTHPHSTAATAAYTADGIEWHPSVQPPPGYLSTAAWNAGDGSWLAAGPTGTHVSHDGGKTWQPLDHANWNALSLPFAVGPDGRIARLISWGELRAVNRTPSPAATREKD